MFLCIAVKYVFSCTVREVALCALQNVCNMVDSRIVIQKVVYDTYADC